MTLGAALLAPCALAQSSELIEAIRVRRPDVTALAAQEQRACARAVAGPCAALARLTLLHGFLLLSDGAAVEAAALLGGSRPPKGLEAFHAWYLGEAQAWSGQRAQALASLARARQTAPPWLAKKIDRRRAELALALGRPGEALGTLEAAAREEPTPELLYARARARAAVGDAAGAAADDRAITVRFPTHPHAALSGRALELAHALSLTFEERLARAQALVAAGAAPRALTELEGLTPPAPDGARLALLRGQALLATGADRPAEAALEAAAQGAPAIAAEALATRARRLMHQSDNPGARAAFAALDRRFPTEPPAEEAGYLGAWLAMNTGDDETAVADFERFEQRHPDSRRRDEARWFKAWAQYRLGRLGATRSTLKALWADFPRSSLVPQARYWATRAAEQLPPSDGGPGFEVSREYREVIGAFPGSFYALLARERLRARGEVPPPLFPERPALLTPKAPAGLRLALELSRAGLLRDASEEIDREVGQVRTAADALPWGHALQQLGEFGAAHALAARLLWGRVYSERQPAALPLLYPRAYRATVESSCAAVGLDPFLAWAIMRRESAFRPEVTSVADARGLMQLIPPTARAVAGDRREEAPEPDELYSPARNIELGTWYLAALQRRLGHPALVAAAYNGGTPAVLRWVAARGDQPLDEWVEQIPFRETRGYVKQVVADSFVYQALYGEAGAGRLSLVLPAPKAAGVEY